MKKYAAQFRHKNTRERCVAGRRTSENGLKIYIYIWSSKELHVKRQLPLVHRYAAVCNPCLWHGQICVYIWIGNSTPRIYQEMMMRRQHEPMTTSAIKILNETWYVLIKSLVISMDGETVKNGDKPCITHRFYFFSFCFVRIPRSRMSQSEGEE